jgi:hypothetical protein
MLHKPGWDLGIMMKLGTWQPVGAVIMIKSEPWRRQLSTGPMILRSIPGKFKTIARHYYFHLALSNAFAVLGLSESERRQKKVRVGPYY